MAAARTVEPVMRHWLFSPVPNQISDDADGLVIPKTYAPLTLGLDDAGHGGFCITERPVW